MYLNFSNFQGRTSAGGGGQALVQKRGQVLDGGIGKNFARWGEPPVPPGKKPCLFWTRHSFLKTQKLVFEEWGLHALDSKSAICWIVDGFWSWQMPELTTIPYCSMVLYLPVLAFSGTYLFWYFHYLHTIQYVHSRNPLLIISSEVSLEQKKLLWFHLKFRHNFFSHAACALTTAFFALFLCLAYSW